MNGFLVWQVGLRIIYRLFNQSCFPFSVLASGCLDCVIHIDKKTGRLVPVDFEKYIPFFLQDNPDESCAKAGHAAYGQVCIGSISVLFRNSEIEGLDGEKFELNIGSKTTYR